MALNFPDSPTLNDEVVLGGKTYKWDGVKWTMIKVIQPTPSATAPTITIISEDPDGVTFTLTNNDDNTAIISYDIDTTQGAVELATTATSSNITVALTAGTYTLTAYATVVGEVATSATASVEVVVPEYVLLYDSNVSATLPLTQIDITGLNITKDDELRLVYTIKGNTTADSYAALFINDNTTTTNYYAQLLIGTGTSLIAVRQNLSRFTQFRSNAPSAGTTDIKISNNDKVVWQDQHVRWIGSAAASLENNNTNAVASGLTISNITKLSIVASGTNEIGTGSRIRLYKVNTGAA